MITTYTMCLGATDECLGSICVPLFIVILPIVGMYRLIKYLRGLFKRPVKAPEPDVQPQFLRITIPVSEDPIEVD